MTELRLKYFTLKPRGTDAYALTSRHAMLMFASHIQAVDPELATQVRIWAQTEADIAKEETDKP
jgi:hypothetical protein